MTTRDEVIAMARECGIEIHERRQQARIGMDAMLGVDLTDKLQKFAALVAAKEREECAVLLVGYPHWLGNVAKSEISAAIRARGQQ